MSDFKINNTQDGAVATPAAEIKAIRRKKAEQKKARQALLTPLPYLTDAWRPLPGESSEPPEGKLTARGSKMQTVAGARKTVEELIERLLEDKRPRQEDTVFSGCRKMSRPGYWDNHEITAITPVAWSNGELIYLDIRCDSLKGEEKDHHIIYRVHTSEDANRKIPFLFDEWKILADAGGLLPIGAYELAQAVITNRRAIAEGTDNFKKIVLLFCEGAKTREGIQELLEQPEIAEYIASLNQQWLVCGIPCGKLGPANVNLSFGIEPSADSPLFIAGNKPGEGNDFSLDYTSDVAQILIVEDNDIDGAREAAKIADRLVCDYRCPSKNVSFVKPPRNAPQGWDDADPYFIGLDDATRFEQFKAPRIYTKDTYDRDMKGQVIPNLKNVRHHFIVEPELKDIVFYDEFRKRVMLTRPIPGSQDSSTASYPKAVEDCMYPEFQMAIQAHEYFPKCNKETTISTVNSYARSRRRNPLVECLEDIVSQYTPNSESIIPQLLEAMGIEVTQIRIVRLERFLMGSMRRIKYPGIKMDNALVLGGGEGLKKSWALKAITEFPEDLCKAYGITGELFSDTPPALTPQNDINCRVHLVGKLLVEFPELCSIMKTEVAHLKQFISSQVDEVMRKYDREISAYPRTCVLAATTNDPYFDRSTSGSRRLWFLPITQPIDIERIKALWIPLHAEMYYRANMLEEKYWIDEPEYIEEFKKEAETHRIRAHWEPFFEDALCEWHDHDGMAVPDVAIPAKCFDYFKATMPALRGIPLSYNDLANWMLRHGWEKFVNIRPNGRKSKQTVFWAKPGSIILGSTIIKSVFPKKLVQYCGDPNGRPEGVHSDWFATDWELIYPPQLEE